MVKACYSTDVFGSQAAWNMASLLSISNYFRLRT